MIHISETQAKAILKFLAQKLDYVGIYTVQFRYESHAYVIKIKQDSFFKWHDTTLCTYDDSNRLIYVSIENIKTPEQLTAVRIVKTLLDFCMNYNIIVYDSRKIFLKKGTTLEQIMIEMDLDEHCF